MIDIGIIVNGLLSGALYALVGLGLSLVFGVMRLVNLAHGELMVLGSYVASVVISATGIDPLLSLVIVVPAVLVLAYAIQRLLFTGLLSRGMEPPLVAAFGLSLLISASLTLIFGGNPRSLAAVYGQTGVKIAGTTLRWSAIITFVMAVVLIVGTHLVVTRTQWGASLRAASTDPTTAATMGINVKQVYAVTFAVASAFAAIAGVLVGIGFSFSPTTGAGYVLIGFAVVVLGGTGSVLGVLWGGLILGLIQSIGAATLGGEYRDLVIYGAFVLILVLGPLFTDARRRFSDAVRRRELAR